MSGGRGRQGGEAVSAVRLRALLRQWVGECCAVDPAGLSDDVPVAEYGLTSRDAVDLSGRLEEVVGRRLPATLLWENPTIDALVASLTATSPAAMADAVGDAMADAVGDAAWASVPDAASQPACAAAPDVAVDAAPGVASDVAPSQAPASGAAAAAAPDLGGDTALPPAPAAAAHPGPASDVAPSQASASGAAAAAAPDLVGDTALPPAPAAASGAASGGGSHPAPAAAPAAASDVVSGSHVVPSVVGDAAAARAAVVAAPVGAAASVGLSEREPVAVVGIGCRLPGGIEGPEQFWRALLAGRDMIGTVPEGRWRDFEDGSATTAEVLARTTGWGGFLEDVAAFDADFFGITPKEAETMDPQQRLLLEVAWEALDHAGIPAGGLAGSATGVFVGLSSLDYGHLTTADPAAVTAWTSTGAAGSIVANRLSYLLDARGPSITVDTACSASLVAVHQACRSLRSQECDTALVGGVNVLLSPAVTAAFDQAGALAADGRCKAFDAAADGIARGEGCAVVVLKRLADAERDGDTVLALVRGSAVNSDGRSAGLMAPNPAAQEQVVRAALRCAGVEPADIDYVEAHGTGTLLGDPIEAGALAAVLGRGRGSDRPLLIGSVKTNLGHLEGAAGLVGLVKTVLALHHGTVPPSLHFRTPNPHIDFDAGRLRVVAVPTALPALGDRVAAAGVSAFGFGGTNAHVVLTAPAPVPLAGRRSPGPLSPGALSTPPPGAGADRAPGPNSGPATGAGSAAPRSAPASGAGSGPGANPGADVGTDVASGAGSGARADVGTDVASGAGSGAGADVGTDVASGAGSGAGADRAPGPNSGPATGTGSAAPRPAPASGAVSGTRADAGSGTRADAGSGTRADVGTDAASGAGAAPASAPASGPDSGRSGGTGRVPYVLVVSARSETRVGEAAAALADWLATPAGGEADLGGLAHTLATRRRGPVAGAVVGRDRVELIRQLRDLARGQTGPAVVAPHRVPEQPAEAPGERPGPVFVFSGYGSQWPGMGQRLLAGDAVFAAAVADLDPVFAAVTGTTLTCLIDDGARTSAVDRTQPLLLGMQLALARTWQAYGITPAAVIGHSMGEVAAAVVTGALDVEDAVRLMVHRARALAAVDEAGGGAMAAVELPDDARAHLLRRHPQVDIAVYASPRRCTVTGPAGPVAALLAELEQAGYAAKALAVTGAGHSAAVDAVLPVLRAHLSGLRPRTPQVPWYSTVDDPAAPVVADLEYWCRNTRRPVCFQQAVTAAAGAGHTLFVEISPHPIAALPVSETLQAVLPGPFVVLPSLRRDGDELLEVRASLAAAHLACGGSGGGLLWPAGPRVIVPSWPWRHSRHWVRSRPAARHRGGHAVLGRRVEVPGTDHVLWHGDVGTGGWNRVERLLHGTPVLSLAAAAHMFLAAAEDALAVTTGDLALHDLELDRLLPLTDSTTVTTRLQPAGPDAADVSIHTQSPSGAWRCHARARVTREPFPARLTRPAPDTEPAVRITQAAPGTAHADPQAPAARLALLDACLHAPTTAPAADTATAPTPAAATAPTTAPAPGRAAVSAGTPAGDIVPAPEPATAGTPAPAPAMALTAATAPAPATVPDVVVPVASSAPGAEPARGAALFPTAVACVHLPTPDPHPHTHTRGGAGIDGVSCQVHLLPADGCCSHAAAGGGQVTAFAEGRPVLHAHGVTLTAPGRGDVPRALRDITYETAWTKAALPAPHDIDPAHWLLLTPMPGSGLEARRFTEPLAEALRAHGGTVTGDGYRPEAIAGLLRSWGQDAGDGPRHVVMLFTGPARPQPADPGHAVRAAADVARHLAAGATDQAPPRLWLVTERALSTTAGEYGDPDRAALAGLVRVLALEQPALRATVVDVDGDPALADDLPRELLAASDADQVVWRAGTRLLARLAPADPHSAPAGKPARFARPDGAYIITGGLGGLGLATARRLAEQGAGRLVLCGRRPATGPASAVIDELRRHGSQVEVVLGDIAAEPTAGMLVAAALSAGHTLAGVAHAAGVLHDRAITELDAADIDLVMAAKATGARHLHQATRGHRPDWWLLFSSAAALTGSPGQAAYAAANAWMDALARNRHADGLPATSIAWGPWAGLGAVPDTARLPMEALQEDQGLDALQLLLAQTRPHLGVLCLDPARIAAAFPGLEAVPYFADLIRDADADTDWPGPAALPALGAAARDVVHQRLMRRAGAVMGYDGDRLDARVPLTDLGLDSLMTVRIQNAVRQDFGIVLPASLALRGATLTDLTDAVVTALGLPGTGTTTPPTPPTPTPAAPAGKTAGAADTGAAHTGTHHTTPALPTVLTPRDAAERLVAGVYQHLTGTAAPGVLQELPHARDPHHAQALADAVNARLHHLGTPLTGPDIAAHPTVAAIADLIRPAVNGTTGSEVRVLKPPTPGHAAPLFVFHPAGGPTTVYRPLVDLLTANRPVYGLDRVAEAATMEDKARHYLRLMRRLWPQGPYHMLGWSFGGCLAYEAACQLHHDGHQPGFLGLIDTILPAALPGLDDRQLLIDRLERFAQYVQTTYGHRIELSHQDLARVPEDEQIDVVLRDIAAAGCQMSPAIIEHQRTSYLDARVGERYRPRPYPGRTVLYRAQDPQPLTTALDPRYLRDQADLGWAQYCPDLQIVPVTGDHLSMIDPPHVTLVADHLDTALAQHP